MFDLATIPGYQAWEILSGMMLAGLVSIWRGIPARILGQAPRQELHEFWKNPSGELNRPEDYQVRTDRSTYLADKIKHYSYPDFSILELGCNIGRNLDALQKQGHTNLVGIEINPSCLDMMRQTYPDLKAKITIGTIEDTLPNMAPRSVDVVFTCAVLMHLHRDSDFVFAEMARITKKTIIILENETGRARKNQPRHYQKIFEGLGFFQVESHYFNDDLFKKGYVLRVFTRKT